MARGAEALRGTKPGPVGRTLAWLRAHGPLSRGVYPRGAPAINESALERCALSGGRLSRSRDKPAETAQGLRCGVSGPLTGCGPCAVAASDESARRLQEPGSASHSQGLFSHALLGQNLKPAEETVLTLMPGGKLRVCRACPDPAAPSGKTGPRLLSPPSPLLSHQGLLCAQTATGWIGLD